MKICDKVKQFPTSAAVETGRQVGMRRGNRVNTVITNKCPVETGRQVGFRLRRNRMK